MRAILEDMRSGEICTCEIPVPELRPGGLLVRTAFSAISSGTERAKVETSEKSLFGKAMARPDLVRQIIGYARTNGIRAAYQKVQTKLDSLSPMGYSCSGEVIGVGEGVSDFRCGDRVACAGGGYANHCEVNWVPRNLVVGIPESLALDAASLTTIGAIAMQGLRQSQLTFGETVLVIGAGLVGVLTIQLARAAGCRVVAIDLDLARVERAALLGAHLALLSSDPRLPLAVREFSRYGADAAIVAAATRSAEPLEMAAQLVRDRGRIVVVGDVGMGVSRQNMYHKELSLVMSRSYGPGRYDPSYEESGNDYPVGYVRWTERRNMQAFVDFLASGAIDVSPLLQQRYRVEEGALAYSELRSGKAYTAIIEYPRRKEETSAVVLTEVPRLRRERPARVRVGCIGAGGFARGYIFPNLKAAHGISLEAVASASGVAAESARRTFGFQRAQTPAELLGDPGLDAVFIATRHQSHAHYTVDALNHGKAVFVEKPLAVDRRQLEEIRQTYKKAAATGNPPFLMVGFNRRFAPATEKLRAFFAGRHEPMMVQVRVNAGFTPSEHWTQQTAEGGRVIGEFCHFVDWALCVVGSRICSIAACALPDGGRYNHDNLAVILSFTDGSIANLVYLANGDPAVPKEHFEVFCEGAVARLDDFQTLELVRDRKAERFRFGRDKGHRRELQLTLEAMAAGVKAPIQFEDLVAVTETTFSINEAICGTRGAPAPPEVDSATLGLTPEEPSRATAIPT